MKFRLKALLFLLFIFYNCNAIAISVDLNNVKELLNNQTNDGKLQLNFDVIYMIMDELDLPELVHMAEANRDFADIAVDVFKRNYGNRRISIMWTADGMLDRFFLDGKWIVDHDSIEIKDYYLTLQFLRHFGNLIPSLYLTLKTTDQKQAIEISKCIEKYCADSLQKLELNIREGDVLDLIKKPFKKVEELTFWEDTEFNESSRQISEIFPVLRSLELYPSRDYSSAYFERTFPHLESLNIHSISERVPGNLTIQLLTKNPQITHLSLTGCSEELLRKVNVILPQLKHLTVERRFSVREEIRFENVVSFDMRAIDHHFNIFFPKLRELNMNCESFFFARWREFLAKHKNLSNLKVDCSYMGEDDFEGISATLPNLQEMTLKNQLPLRKIDFIIRFLKKNTKMTKLHVKRAMKNLKKELELEFQSKWKIYDNSSGIHIEII